MARAGGQTGNPEAKVSGDAEMSTDWREVGVTNEMPAVLPSGLHAAESEPDFSAQYAAQQNGDREPSPEEKVKIVALAVLARNKGAIRKTSRETGVPEGKLKIWKQEQTGKIGNPFEEPKKAVVQRVRLSSSSDLEHSQKKLVQVINTIVDSLPKMLSKATLTEQVKTLNQLVSIKGEIDDLLAPPTPTGMTADELKDMAKKKLELKKRNADEPA